MVALLETHPSITRHPSMGPFADGDAGHLRLVTGDAAGPAVPPVVPAVAAMSYRRRRVVAALVAAFMVWLVVSTAVTLASWASGAGESTLDGSEPAVHVVRSGDSVWSVARTYQPDGDVRPLVDRIISLNGSADLFVGQRLVLVP